MTPTVFADRTAAGEALGAVLAGILGPPGEAGEGVVLGIPRGGVVVAAPVAKALGFALDVAVARKVGAPANPELGLGAVGPGGVVVIDVSLAERLMVDRDWLDRRVAVLAEEVRLKEETLRAGRSPVPVEGRLAVVVDDGVATGGTARAVGQWLAGAGAAHRVLAVPVGAPEPLEQLRGVYDDVLALAEPPGFRAVGQFYDSFTPVSDDEVRQALEDAATPPPS
jgi:predicted phosphoribosyltransferase